MSEPPALLDGLSEEAVWRLEAACCRFEDAWQSGRRPRLEDLTGSAGDERLALLRELLRLEVYYRRQAGEDPRPREYQRRFPEAGPWLHEIIDGHSPAEVETPPEPSRHGPAGRRARLDTDRNLLFGVLALQADLIDNERFAKACALWAADKDRPLAQVLVEQGWVTLQDRADVEKLLRRKLAKHGGDAQASLTEAVNRPVAASLAGLADPEVQASLAGAAASVDPGRTIDHLPPAEGLRFRRLRPHAQGGLGEVFVAEDLELHREVALKEIKEEHAHHPSSRARFVLEAEITGGLEHPGVVPVYGLGLYPNGRPFYAMRFIKGDTLRDAVRQFHAASPAGFDSVGFRQLLGRFVDVCQAVAYAHSRGVLHRDLKPGNIMLGKFGETLVVDWGLAKVVGREERVGPAEEVTLRPAPGGGWSGTLAGSAVGTPGFMSPEQAAGKVEELGPATDVYSLGATLYEVLTNQAPLRGNVDEALRRTQAGDWLPPRRVNPAVPAALEAVCCKAMALRPEGRYASALELARDVEQWLADEPVAVYREPLGARRRRWMRKHPRKLTAAAVLLVAAVVGLTAGMLLLERSKREAQENFELTRAAAHKFLVAVNEEQLLDEPAMQGLRQQLLTDALDYYQKFLEKRPGDPAVLREQAEASRQLGEVFGQVGRVEAVALIKRSLEAFHDLQGRAPADPAVRRGLAESHVALADLQVQAGQPEEGQLQASGAIHILAGLRAESPNDVDVSRLLSRSFESRATAEVHLGLVDAAIADNAEAVQFQEHAITSLLRKYRGVQFSRIAPWDGSIPSNFAGSRRWEYYLAGTERLANSILLSRVWTNQGVLLKTAGRKAAGAQSLHWATQIARNLQSNSARLGRLRNGLAVALLNAGHVEVELGRPAGGLPLLAEALESSSKLLRDDELVADYGATHMQAAGYRGEALFLAGQTARAAESLHEALAVAEVLRKGERKDRALLANRARFLGVLGRLQGDSGQVERGLESCEQAGKEQEQALALAPQDRSLHSEWLRTREALAGLRVRAGRADREAWLREQRQIVSERKQLAARYPVLPHFECQVGASTAVLAGLLLEAGQAREALAVVDEVLPAHERLVQADRLLTRPRATETGQQSDERLLAIGQLSPFASFPTWRTEPEDCQLRRVEGELLAWKCAALARTGQGAAAAEGVRRAIGIAEQLAQGGECLLCPPCSWPSLLATLAVQVSRQEPCYLYDLACYLALASTLPDAAGGRDAAGKALAALRAYRAAGFDNAHKLRTDPRLGPLRDRADFQGLVRDLESQPLVTQRTSAPGLTLPRRSPSSIR